MRAQLLTGHISKENVQRSDYVIEVKPVKQQTQLLWHIVMTVTHFILSYPHNFNCRV